MDLKDIPKKDLIKALRKIKGVAIYTIENKYIVEIEKDGEANGTKTN